MQENGRRETFLIIDSLISLISNIYNLSFFAKQEIPITGLIQIAKIINYLLGCILIISQILDKSPLFILTGFGAFTAVLILIFKDAILGFVAGIQLISNRMIKNNDWIEMPKYEANGTVLEVGLTTVKVQNFDKTITSIPTYALISESFKNWQAMYEGGGRRIKRSIHIDISTIKFCTEKMLEKYAKLDYVADYIEKTKKKHGRSVKKPLSKRN